ALAIAATMAPPATSTSAIWAQRLSGARIRRAISESSRPHASASRGAAWTGCWWTTCDPPGCGSDPAAVTAWLPVRRGRPAAEPGYRVDHKHVDRKQRHAPERVRLHEHQLPQPVDAAGDGHEPSGPLAARIEHVRRGELKDAEHEHDPAPRAQ